LIGKQAESYLQRFFAKTTAQGYERTTGGNRFLAGLDDVWSFQIDPEQVGEDTNWWRPETFGGNWQSLRTSTSSWSNQGLRYYKGLAWYRQTVRLPEDCKGKRVFLWCGGIDELAKVWVNGHELGISPRASFTPFEMDATSAVRAGQPNTVVFCVSNATLNEIGTGGITGPVIFYEPAGGHNAKIRNAKPPNTVFPEY
jgi:beta-galactosidase/beta-glucuronidase